ncbi:hypothetical protein GCM10010502_12320 [Kitasatospora aureofaciens]|uniref:Uncharacterized protein n=1 Tax=Kitasatospora aureofaciens TaxID=1894 RepID=A0A8H9LMV8_KITAU|nr:hypothetical protein GCM10010502_12320 [Kitasatospora aureofaciens]
MRGGPGAVVAETGRAARARSVRAPGVRGIEWERARKQPLRFANLSGAGSWIT